MAKKVWEQIVEGLQELSRKLKGNIAIKTKRNELCPDCNNEAGLKEACETCYGRGFIRYVVEI